MAVHTAQIPSTIPMGNTAAAIVTTAPTIPMPRMRREYMVMMGMIPITTNNPARLPFTTKNVISTR